MLKPFEKHKASRNSDSWNGKNCSVSFLFEVVVRGEVRSPDWSPSAAKAVQSAFESTAESHGRQFAGVRGNQRNVQVP